MKLRSEWGVAFFFSVVWLQSTARSSKIWNNEDNEIPFEVTPRKKKSNTPIHFVTSFQLDSNEI